MRRNRLNIKRKTKELVERGSPILKTGKTHKPKDPKVLAVTQLKNNGKKNLHSISHGAFAFQHGYYNGSLDKRSHLGQIVSEMECDYARHMGYDSFAASPIVLREKIRLLCGNWIFQAFYRASDLTLAHLRASENLTNRILDALGMKPTPREVSLKEHVERKLKAKRRRTED